MTVALFLFAQIIMGGLTVLKLLAPKIVTLHLTLAASFLVVLKLVQFQLHPETFSTPVPKIIRYLLPIGFLLVCGQILLGGWVASNYAGTACMDFPTCNGQWFPAFTGPIGAQVIHRLGAYTLVAFFAVQFFLSLRWRAGVDGALKGLIAKMFFIVLAQTVAGIANVLWMVPAWLTVVHLGLALYLLLCIARNFVFGEAAFARITHTPPCMLKNHPDSRAGSP